MDDDDLRRGLPTVHVKWDEATAVLAGDALQTLAFELLTDPALARPRRASRLVAWALPRPRAREGMVLGQALDIAAETAAAPLTLDRDHRAAGRQDRRADPLCPPRRARFWPGADPAPLRAYAEALGLAFQIADDILDVTGDAAKAGKRLHKDAAGRQGHFRLACWGWTARAPAPPILMDEA